jgi:hypothetical protein
MKEIENNSGIIISYMTMRRLIGILGMALPFVVVIGGAINNPYYNVLGSISQYYYSNMRDFFVGLLCAIAFFLTTYKGHENDHAFMILSGVFLLGVALFPTSIVNAPHQQVGIFQICDNTSMWIHLTFAGLYFLTLSYISYFLFTKSDQKKLKRRKRIRNRIYRTCGVVMVVSVLLIFVYFVFFEDTFISNVKPVLILEGVALWAFGFSWLIKGETFWKDKK